MILPMLCRRPGGTRTVRVHNTHSMCACVFARARVCDSLHSLADRSKRQRGHTKYIIVIICTRHTWLLLGDRQLAGDSCANAMLHIKILYSS